MTILVAVKKNGKVFIGADRMTTFGTEYSTDLVNNSKLIKLKHAYLATSGYSLIDNVIEHLFHSKHKMMESAFASRADVFQFFLDFYTELKKNYTLVDMGKETYAGIYNVFLVVTPTSIYGVASNLSVSEYSNYAAKGSGSDHAVGCLYGLYDLIDDGKELTRLAVEAACHFSIYCKEPIDLVEVKASDFGKLSTRSHKDHGKNLITHKTRTGTSKLKVAKKKAAAPKKKATPKSAQTRKP
jgi:ATP-dependent protease HslVU (ClpYQ) peptidase subunit